MLLRTSLEISLWTDFFQPPLPARKWSGSSGGSSGSTLPGKGGIAFRDGEPPDVPPVLSSRRRPSQKENDSSTDFYLAPTDSTSSTEVYCFSLFPSPTYIASIRRYINLVCCKGCPLGDHSIDVKTSVKNLTMSKHSRK